jgi:type IV pilus assembly protein PilO
MNGVETHKAKDLDISELNIQNIGMWPVQYKGILFAIVFCTCIAAGYFLHVTELYAQLSQLTTKEAELRTTYERKAFEAANLELYRQQMADLEESFGALLAQLPGETEVPGLLEDITEVGYGSSLDIKAISLQPERAQEFYVELPIKVVAEGGYHDVGTFVSAVANLPRIVTLHDYTLSAQAKVGRLVFEVEAKTYRYKGLDD